MGNRELSRLSQTTIESNRWIRKTLCHRLLSYKFKREQSIWVSTIDGGKVQKNFDAINLIFVPLA